MKRNSFVLLSVMMGLCLMCNHVNAVPTMMNYQGLMEVDGVKFTGTGLFRFAIMDDTGTNQYWSNDGLEPPETNVPIPVTEGLFNVLLGDISLMDPIGQNIFDYEPVFLRIWFDDHVFGLQLLSPDQELVTVPYSFNAADTSQLEGKGGAYYLDWNNLQNVPPGFADDDDDDQPDNDAEVPDGISINNVRLYAPAGLGYVGIGMSSPSEQLQVNGKIKSEGEIIENAADYGVYVNASGQDGFNVYHAGVPSTQATSAYHNGVEVAGAEGHGFFAGQADRDGVNIHNAGSPSMTQSSASSNGVEVAGTQGSGLYVGHADIHGVSINSAANNGIFVDEAGSDGLHVITAGTPSSSQASISSNGVEIEGAQGHGMFIGKADVNGMKLMSSGEDGIVVVSAGSPSITTIIPGSNGLEIQGAQGRGIAIGRADDDGIFVFESGDKGVMVGSAVTKGFEITNSGDDGFYVNSAGSPSSVITTSLVCGVEIGGAQGYGMFIGQSDLDGIHVYRAGVTGGSASSEDNGVEIEGAEGNGLYVGIANLDGLHVLRAGNTATYQTSTELNGVEVAGALDNGLYVGEAGNDGLHVYHAGTPSTQVSSSMNNGLEIEGAQGHGVYIGHSGNTSLVVNDAGTDGIAINNAVDNGIIVYDTGNMGISIWGSVAADGVYMNGPSDDGVYVYNCGDIGIHANTTLDDGFGLHTDDRTYSGDGYYPVKSGTFALNKGSEILENGDIVAIAGGYTEELIDDTGVKVIHVKKVGSMNRESVIGVVEKKAMIREELEKNSDGTTRVDRSLRLKDGIIEPEDYLAVTIIGPAEVKVDPDESIQPGNMLTVNHHGEARKVQILEINGVRMAENTGIIGKALEESDGSGMMTVFINCK